MLTPAIKDFFISIDENASGEIDIMEVEHLHADAVPRELASLFEIDSLADLFDILDSDGSGTIREDEFVDGMLKIAESKFNNVPSEAIIQLKLMRSLRLRTARALQWTH